MPTLTLQPSAGIDTFIDDLNPTVNQGTATTMIVGRRLASGSQHTAKGLIDFDLSTFNPSWTLISATLRLQVTSETNTTDRNVAIHRALTQWFETGSTWNLRNTSGSVAWAGGAGGGLGSDYATVATDTTAITAPGSFDFDVTNDVLGWLESSFSQFGWWMIGEAVDDSSKTFISSDSGSSRPQLILIYSETAVDLHPNAATGKDAFVNLSTPSNNWGIATTVHIGEDSGDSDRTGFLQFDLSSIPANATILSATLQLVWSGIQSTSQVLNFYRLLLDWTEGTANGSAGTVSWTNRMSSTAWNSGGARGSGTDREATSNLTINASAVEVGIRSNHDVTTDVQAWVNGTANYGWTIDFSFFTGSNNVAAFYSSDNTDQSVSPRLLVEYVVQRMAGSVSGTSTATATVVAAGNLVGTAAGSSTVSSTLLTNEFIKGVAAGIASDSAIISAAGYMTAVADGVAFLSGELRSQIFISPGLAEGTSSASAHILGIYRLEGISEGVGSASAEPAFQGQLRGAADGFGFAEARGYAKALHVATVIGCNPVPLLYITDGSVKPNGQLNWVNLLSEKSGYKLKSWKPVISQYKDGGRFSSSPLSQGRRLRSRSFDNVIEVFDLAAVSYNQDGLISYQRDLLAFQESAADYWVSDYVISPFYLVARAARETNIRYAIIHLMSIPELENPYIQPFFDDRGSAMAALTLRVERGHWAATPPGQFECVPISSQRSWTVAGWQTGT